MLSKFMSSKIFLRYNLNKLESSIADSDQNMVLVRGLPGTGKGFASENICRKYFKSVFSIDLKSEKRKFFLPLRFIDSPSDFINALELTYHKQYVPGKTALVIKDVPLIKGLWESLEILSSRLNNLKVVGTSSSLDVSQSEKEQVELKPLTFLEFLYALGKDDLADKIKTTFEGLQELSQNDFSLTNFLYLQYLLVGGMPDAIDVFIKKHIIPKVELSKKSNLEDIKAKLKVADDTGKLRLFHVFDNILPSLLSPSGLFVSSSVFHKRTDMNATKTINALIDTGSAIISRQTKELTLSMPLSAKKSKFKLYYPDIGLLVTALNSAGFYKKNEVIEAVLHEDNHSSVPIIYENAVAIHLARNHPDLYFYAWFDKMNHRRCIDFLYFSESRNITKRKIVPIVFLPPNTKAVAQFKEIIRKNKSKLTSPYVFYSGNVKTEDDMTYLPYFMAELL